MNANLPYSNPLNVSLIEHPNSAWWSDPVTSVLIGAILGALITGLLPLLIEFYKNCQLKWNDKIQAHNNLYGYKYTLSQYYYSLLASKIGAENSILYAKILAVRHLDFTEIGKLQKDGRTEKANQALNRLISSYLDKSPDFKRGLESLKEMTNLGIQIGLSNEKFWGLIGQIKILFPDKKVVDLVRAIQVAQYNLSTLESNNDKTYETITVEMVESHKSINSNEYRDIWVSERENKLKETKQQQLSTLYEKMADFNLKIDNLLNYLEECLQYQDKKCWQFWK